VGYARAADGGNDFGKFFGGHSFNVRQPQAVGIPRTVCVRQLRLAVGRESTSRWYLDLICHQVPQKGKSRPYWIPGTWLSGFPPGPPRTDEANVRSNTFAPILLHLGPTFDYVETSKTLDQSEVDKDVREVTDTYKVFAEKDLVDKNCLVSSSRHFLTMKALIRQHNLDSLAVRCWPELPGPPSAGGMDQWCYMALARLASEGFPISCEGDVDGALVA